MDETEIYLSAPDKIQCLMMIAVIVVGGLGLWQFIYRFFRDQENSPLMSIFRAGAVSLWMTGIMCHVAIKSIDSIGKWDRPEPQRAQVAITDLPTRPAAADPIRPAPYAKPMPTEPPKPVPAARQSAYRPRL